MPFVDCELCSTGSHAARYDASSEEDDGMVLIGEHD